jgi:hypothetical protein
MRRRCGGVVVGTLPNASSTVVRTSLLPLPGSLAGQVSSCSGTEGMAPALTLGRAQTAKIASNEHWQFFHRFTHFAIAALLMEVSRALNRIVAPGMGTNDPMSRGTRKPCRCQGIAIRGERRSARSRAPPLLRQRKPYLTGSPPSRRERRYRRVVEWSEYNSRLSRKQDVFPIMR